MRTLTIGLTGLTLSLLAACGPLPQRQVEAPAPAKVAQTDHKGLDPDQVICRRYEETGSRVRQTKVCKTRQAWDDDARLAQEAIRSVDTATQRGGGN